MLGQSRRGLTNSSDDSQSSLDQQGSLNQLDTNADNIVGSGAFSINTALLATTGSSGSSGGGVAVSLNSDTTVTATADGDVVTSAGSGLVFNNTFGSGASSISSAITAAEQALQAIATNSVTANVTFTASDQGANGDLATNSFFTVTVSFSQLKAALQAHENTAVGAAAVASLTTDVSGGKGFNLPQAYAKMLGLYSGTVGQDTVTLNTHYLSGNGQDVINALTHELSEGSMGRIGGLGDQNSFWSTMDLFRYNASGQLDTTDGRDNVTTYFSYNGGSSHSALTFNNEYTSNGKQNGGDTADFTQLDVFGVGQSGETFGLSLTDLQVMEALGWNPTSQGLKNLTYANDFTGSGFGDILWSNGGQLGIWLENSSLNPTWVVLSNNTNGWSVVGTGDYNGDGVNDILWGQGNQLGIWTENSNLTPTWQVLSSNTNGWSVVGSGDYNGDHVNDILWGQGNQLGVWTENSSLNPTWTLLSNNTNGWSVVGSGDYNGDGTSDILWQNGSQLGVWTENSKLVPTWTLLSNNTNGWSVVGSGDYNGDGTSDILWQNGSQLGVWLENSKLTPTWDVLSSNTNGWSVVGSSDYNGDGISDILWQNGNQLGVWLENSQLNPTWKLLSGNTNGWSPTGNGSPGLA